MFDTFDFMAFNWCCILGGPITLLYPTLSLPLLLWPNWDMPLFLFIETGNPLGIPVNPMKSKEYARSYCEQFL